MALSIPKVVQALFVQSADASRVRDNVVTALQPVLDFLGQYFTPGNDGSLTIPRAVNVTGGLITTTLAASQAAINGPLTAAAATLTSLTVRGPAYFSNTLGNTNGVIVQAGAPGAAFYVTNVTGQPNFVVYDTGAVGAAGPITAPSFVSTAGFKQTVKMGQYFQTAYPGGQKSTIEPLYNVTNGAANSKVARHIAPRAGSVTAIAVDNETPVATTGDVGVAVNGNVVVYPRLLTANSGKGYITYPKGTVNFAAGDTLTCVCGFGATNITVAIAVSFEIETGA